MSKLRSVLDGLSGRKDVDLRISNGIVSFSFDDFPLSAVTAGAEVLNEFRAKGTYYTSMSHLGIVWSQGAYFSTPDLQNLLRDGHELACHTFGHLNCAEVPLDVCLSDIKKNLRAFQEVLGDVEICNFSYPYGAWTPELAKVLARRFATCRTVHEGLNVGRVNLALLNACAIYSRNLNIEDLRRLVRRASDERGWLILYTHDVSENPTEWGCTPEELRILVSAAFECGCEVLPVRNAVGKIAYPFG